VNKYKASFILATTLAALYSLGALFTGGDGFLNNPDEAPVGFDLASFLLIFLLGFLIGLIPFRKILNSLKNK
jgi:hypothetical protein